MLSASGATQTCTYTGTGQDTFTVPAGVSSLHVVAVGGLGGGREGHAGGFGAQASADVPVQSGAALYVEVAGNGGPANAGTDIAPGTGGAGGFNGGGAGGDGGAHAPGVGGFGGGGGGGATDLRSTPASAGLSPDPRLLVAAGGGGSAANGAAGAGIGGAAGASGTGSSGSSGGGQPGTGGGGGLGGSGEPGTDAAGPGATGQTGAPGDGGAGGAGGASLGGSSAVGDGGGGAGGGYYGGGGGGGGGGDDGNSGGGGGGASFPTGAMLATDATTASLTITYTPTLGSTVTSVSCTSPVMVGRSTTCIATVTATPGTLAGWVTFSSDSSGSFSPNACSLETAPTTALASCAVAYSPTVGGTHTITASYAADATHGPSSGSTALNVIPPATVPATPLAVPPPTPQVGTSAGVSGKSGTVTVSCTGRAAVALAPGQMVPVGCTINATQGSVTLSFATPTGPVTGTFSGGTFQVFQSSSGSVQLVLVSSAPRRPPGISAVRTAARTTSVHLWATVHGRRYSVRGRDSVTTARGTQSKWETIETHSGTRTVVTQGTVSVRDLHRHTSIVVRARHSYLAQPLIVLDHPSRPGRP